MAKRETNEAKRAAFKAIIENLLGPLGWSQKDLTVYAGCPLSAFKHGKSMGTNAFRAFMASIPARNTPGLRARLVELRDIAANHLAREQKDLAAETLEANLKGVVSRRDFEVEYHTKKLAEVHEEGRKSKAGDVEGLRGWEAERRLEYATKVPTEAGLKATSAGLTRYEWDVRYHTERLDEAQKLDVNAEAERQRASRAEYYQKRVTKAEKELAVREKNLATWKEAV